MSILQRLHKLIDYKQSEVRNAGITTIIMVFVLYNISLYKNFLILQDLISNLLLYCIGGLISLIGISLAGVAIVISMFNTYQMKLINAFKDGAFATLLYDFKWFALVATVLISIYTLTIIAVNTPLQIMPELYFYASLFLYVYALFYLLFYACALIGNCIYLADIKMKIENIETDSTDIAAIVSQHAIDLLVALIYNKDKNYAIEFYNQLINVIDQSDYNNKEDIVKYIREKYTRL